MKYLIIILLLIGVAGCSTTRSVFYSKAQDRAKIGEHVKSFHQALYWGDVNVAMSFVDPTYQEQFMPIALERAEKEKLVEFKIQSVTIDDKQETATVEVKVQFYKVPQLLVNTRLERQQWNLRYLEHWMFTEILDQKLL